MQLTFEQLPAAVSQILAKVEAIEHHLTHPKAIPAPQGEDLLTITQAAELLHLAVPTIYGLVHRREIPSMKKGKRLYFSSIELIQWTKSGKKQTNTEIVREADAYIGNINKKKSA